MRPLALCACLAGCNLPVYDLSSATADPNSTSTSSTSTSLSTTATSDPTDATSTGDPLTTSPPPRDHPPGWCDVWNDACPEGQKCMPVSLDGDNAPESLRCVPLAPMPDGLYEPCMLLGTGADGLDTCDRSMACKFADADTLTGTCIGFCTGSPEDPGCTDPAAVCHINGAGDDFFCYLPCDPLAQDCSADNECLPHLSAVDLFICVNDGSDDEGQVFDACEYLNACDPGLLCANKSLATECDPNAPGCCLPFCDTSKPNTCPGAGLECLSWYEEGQAPPNYQHVGLCGLP